MSDLQIVLIVIGGIIIAGVLIFNWWQERKFHQQIDQNFSAFEHEAAETPPIPTNEITQEYEPELDEHDFAIDPHRFKDNDLPAAVDIVAEQEMPGDQVSTVTELETAPTFPIETGDADIKSTRHDDIKAIIQNAFEADSVNEATVTETPNSDVTQSTSNQLPANLHSQVDWAALLYLQGAASVKDVQALLKDNFNHYDKPTFVHVQINDSWFLLSDIADKAEFSVQPVSKISCSIQLADRAGPIARSVLNRFQLAVESLGLDINAHVEWQSAGDALNEAVALDKFCIEVDKTMGFHLLHGENGAFTGTKLRGLAEAQGMQLENDGTFKFFDDTAAQDSQLKQPQFVMFNRDHYPFNADMLRSSVVKSITFQLDIPHVKNCIEAFNTMLQAAKQMETGLNAQLVDDNNRPLSDVQIEKIRHQLKIIQATMLTRGIVPGSDCAHRLFS